MVSIVRAGEARGRVTAHPCSVCVATVRAPASLGVTSTTQMHTRNVAHTGDSLLDAVRRAVPGVSVGKILIQRDEEHPLKLPQVVYPRRMQALALRCCSCGSHCNGHHAHTCTHSWRAYLPLRRGPGDSVWFGMLRCLHVQLYYIKLPSDIASKQVILVDPMLGTAGSSTCAIKVGKHIQLCGASSPVLRGLLIDCAVYTRPVVF